MVIGAHLEQPPRTVENRDGERRKLRLGTAAESGSGLAMNVVVHDLSETGLLLQTSAALSIDDKIEVLLPQAGPTAASVVWASNDFFGCRFETRISLAVVSAAQLQGGPQPASGSSEESGPAESGLDHEETFGTRLRRLRKERRISLVGLARQISVSKPTVWKWEKDDVRPRQKSIEALAAALDLSERELLFGKKGADVPAAEAVSAVSGSPQPLSELVKGCKDQIAQAVGTNADNVSITINI